MGQSYNASSSRSTSSSYLVKTAMTGTGDKKRRQLYQCRGTHQCLYLLPENHPFWRGEMSQHRPRRCDPRRWVFRSIALRGVNHPTNPLRVTYYQTACSWSFNSRLLSLSAMKFRTILRLSTSPGSRPRLSWRTNRLFWLERISRFMSAWPRSICDSFW